MSCLLNALIRLAYIIGVINTILSPALCYVEVTPSVSVCDGVETKICENKLLVSFMLNNEAPLWDIELTIDEDTELTLKDEENGEEGGVEFTVETPLTITVEKKEQTIYGLVFMKTQNSYHETIKKIILPRSEPAPYCDSNCACCYQPYNEDPTQMVYTMRCYVKDIDDGTYGNIGDEIYYDMYRILSPSIGYEVKATGLRGAGKDDITRVASVGSWGTSENVNVTLTDRDHDDLALYATLVSSPSANKHPLSGYYLLMKRVKSSSQHRVVTPNSYLIPTFHFDNVDSILGAPVEKYIANGKQICFSSESFPYDPTTETQKLENLFMCPTGNRSDCYNDKLVFDQLHPFKDNHFTFQTPQCNPIITTTDIYGVDMIQYSPLSVKVECSPGSTIGINLVLYDGAFSLIRRRANPVLKGESTTLMGTDVSYNSQLSNSSKSGGVVRLNLNNCKYRMKYTDVKFDMPFEPLVSYVEHSMKPLGTLIYRIKLPKVIASTNTNIYSTGYTCSIELVDNGKLLTSWDYKFNGTGEDPDTGGEGNIPGATFDPLKYGNRVNSVTECLQPRTLYSYDRGLFCSVQCTYDETFDFIPRNTLPTTVLDKLVGDIGKCNPVDCLVKYGISKPLFNIKTRTCIDSLLVDNTNPGTGDGGAGDKPDIEEQYPSPAPPLPELPCGDHGVYLPEPQHSCKCEQNYVTVIEPGTTSVKYCSVYRQPPSVTPGGEEEEDTKYVTNTAGGTFKYEILLAALLILALFGIISAIVSVKVVRKRRRQGKPGCVCKKPKTQQSNKLKCDPLKVVLPSPKGGETIIEYNEDNSVVDTNGNAHEAPIFMDEETKSVDNISISETSYCDAGVFL